jgi:hypothetical protein
MSAANQPAVPGQKPVSIGRNDSPGSDGNEGGGETVTTHYCARTAGVVIRASVEHVGLVGDTELTVNVKWPASTFCAPPCRKPAPPCDQPPDCQNVPGNGPDAGNFGILYGEATADPVPFLNKADTPAVSPYPEPPANPPNQVVIPPAPEPPANPPDQVVARRRRKPSRRPG